jgi:hypothetical protein
MAGTPRAANLPPKYLLSRLPDGFDFIFTSRRQDRDMTKSSTAEVQRHNAERQLFTARRGLAHLVEMYESGQWRLYYKKEEAFAEAVRNARQAVEQWTSVVDQIDAGTPAKS